MTDTWSEIEGTAEARWQTLVEQIPAVVYVSNFDEKFTLRYIAPGIEQLLGYPPSVFLDDHDFWYSLVHPDDYAEIKAEGRRTHEQGVPWEYEYRMFHRDGSEVRIWEREVLVCDDAGNPVLSQGVMMDVTALHRAREALRTERNRTQRYLDASDALLMHLDGEGRVLMLNRTACDLLGYHESDLVGRDWFDTCVSAPDRPERRAVYDEHVRLGHDLPQCEANVLCRDGTERAMLWHGSLVREDDGRPGVLISGIDVTERRRAEDQVVYLAYHDPLTGLPNRILLQKHLELALARARRGSRSVALLFLDLNDFKLVNDGLGHAAGDELLSQVAARLRRHVRDSDTLARQGGDEFLVLIPDIEGDAEERARTAAQRLVDAVREPFRIGGTEFDIGVSVGIAFFPGDAKDSDSLLEHADAAMYEAKSDTSTDLRIYRSSVRGMHGIERLSFTRRLHQAIETGELSLHWQPIIELEQGALAAVEALVRWNDPRHGVRNAGQFVPAAERSGMLDALDDWVIHAFSEQRRAWRAQGYEPNAGFNLSPRQLRPERLAPMLEAIGAGGSLRRVTIELTEGVAQYDDVATRGVLNTLSDAGIRLALDDFGVAYSSLSRLVELPVDWIKIDRAFLRGVPANPPAVTLLASIVDLVGALGVRVLVEGVETEEQRRHLVSIGVGFAQGYHLGVPVAVEELEPLLAASPYARIAP